MLESSRGCVGVPLVSWNFHPKHFGAFMACLALFPHHFVLGGLSVCFAPLAFFMPSRKTQGPDHPRPTMDVPPDPANLSAGWPWIVACAWSVLSWWFWDAWGCLVPPAYHTHGRERWRRGRGRSLAWGCPVPAPQHPHPTIDFGTDGAGDLDRFPASSLLGGVVAATRSVGLWCPFPPPPTATGGSQPETAMKGHSFFRRPVPEKGAPCSFSGTFDPPTHAFAPHRHRQDLGAVFRGPKA